MNRQQLRVFEQTLKLQLADVTGPSAQAALQAAHIEAHGKVLAGGRSREQVAPDYVHVVDGARDRPLQQAKTTLVTLYDYRREALSFALRVLRKNSPVKSGRYRNAHTAFVNDQAVPGLPLRLRPADRVMVVNTEPYARRIEVGKREDGRPFVISVPPGIYERSLQEIRRRYGQAVRVRVGYVDLAGAYATKGKLKPSYVGSNGKVTKRRQKPGSPVRFPAIFIEAV